VLEAKQIVDQIVGHTQRFFGRSEHQKHRDNGDTVSRYAML
jgi:hypothetical protein